MDTQLEMGIESIIRILPYSYADILSFDFNQFRRTLDRAISIAEKQTHKNDQDG